jgi:hypothetical protein
MFEDVISNDAEARMRAVLAKQGDPVDSKLPETDFGKLAFHHRHHGLSPRCVEFACQRHVKAELFHHVRVAPTVEMGES